MDSKWETVIGLEVHVQLATASKIFSGTPTDYGASPNSQASLIDLGFPGTLPVINESVVRMAIIFGKAINGKIDRQSVFARKNYFYPDLPKGYQISQYDSPIVSGGSLQIDPTIEHSIVPIERAHLEEDAGKSIHFAQLGYTGIDLNRAGTPLLEIVTAPTIYSSLDAIKFLKRLRELVVHLRICDGNMQEGSFRCDANVSVRPRNSTNLGTRAEIKNLNSFKFVENAIEFERKRQISILESGGTIIQETRLYDEKKNETRAMRTKENEYDYRYFPDPDLLPLEIDEEVILKIAENLPELPDAKRSRYSHEYGLETDEINLLLSDPLITDYFEETLVSGSPDAKSSFNWITGELFRLLNQSGLKISDSKVDASHMGELLREIDCGTVPKSKAKEIFQRMWKERKSAKELVEITKFNESFNEIDLGNWIDEVVLENESQVNQFLLGKDKILGFLIGQVMKKSLGTADPKMVSEVLKKTLNKLKEKKGG